MANVLIMRFSAIGDVAICVPVIDSLARQYPHHQYTFLSRKFMQPLFEHCPANVRFVGVDLENYRGVAGMYRLYRELLKCRFDAVADLHDVLRTKLLRIFFKCSGLMVRHIDKGRREKRLLAAKKGKTMRLLKLTTERYADVFRALNQPVALIDFRSIFGSSRGDLGQVEWLTGKKSGVWVGIAPFAQHEGKIFPTDRMEKILMRFAKRVNLRVFLFGGGDAEQKVLDEWCGKYPQTISVAGKLKLRDELVLMSHLDVMLSMDSANMHLASLTATPVVSIWGATHPYAGFCGYRQPYEYVIQADLFCRPCSVYGNKPCYRKNMECMSFITPEMVIERLDDVLRLSLGVH